MNIALFLQIVQLPFLFIPLKFLENLFVISHDSSFSAEIIYKFLFRIPLFVDSFLFAWQVFSFVIQATYRNYDGLSESVLRNNM